MKQIMLTIIMLAIALALVIAVIIPISTHSAEVGGNAVLKGQSVIVRFSQVLR